MFSTFPELHWVHRFEFIRFMSLRNLFNPTFPNLNLVIVTSRALLVLLHQSHSPNLSLIGPKNVPCFSLSQSDCHITAWRHFTSLCRSTNSKDLYVTFGFILPWFAASSTISFGPKLQWLGIHWKWMCQPFSMILKTLLWIHCTVAAKTFGFLCKNRYKLLFESVKITALPGEFWNRIQSVAFLIADNSAETIEDVSCSLHCDVRSLTGT